MGHAKRTQKKQRQQQKQRQPRRHSGREAAAAAETGGITFAFTLALLAVAGAAFFAHNNQGLLVTLFGSSGDGAAAVVAEAVAGGNEQAQRLESLATVSACQANVSHQVKFEQLAHIKIWTIESFLPQEQALALHGLLNQEAVPTEGADGSAWVYTNNQVTSDGRGTNNKVRGNNGIGDRRGRAAWARDLGSFAYSKNELNATSSTFQLVQDFFSSSETLQCMSALTGIDLVEVTDMFVSMYVQGDFLTTHQDYNLGTYAFVHQLSKDWEPGFGGELVFSCNHDRFRPNICKTAAPSFNTLTIFSTRPELVDHFVKEVRVDAERNRRFAVTGWIASADDKTFNKDTEAMRIQKGKY